MISLNQLLLMAMFEIGEYSGKQGIVKVFDDVYEAAKQDYCLLADLALIIRVLKDTLSDRNNEYLYDDYIVMQLIILLEAQMNLKDDEKRYFSEVVGIEIQE